MSKEVDALIEGAFPKSGFNCVHTYTDEELARAKTNPLEKAVNPSHYKQFSVESIVMMERIYGLEATIHFAELNAFKYSIRAGFKDSAEQDLAKRDWYLNKAQELREKLNGTK